MIESELKLLKTSIENVLKMTEGLSLEQWNEIPKGFSNNMVWNVAHLAVTQKLLIYGLSSKPLSLEEDFVAKYKKGSRPEKLVDKKEIEVILTEFKSQFLTLEMDLEDLQASVYQSYPTSYFYTIENFNDALAFNNLHYGLHVSSMLKIRKLIAKK